MQIRRDTLPATLFIFLGLGLSFLIIYSNGFYLSWAGYLMTFLFFSLTLMGLWFIEGIEVKENILTKSHCWGLIKFRRDLNGLIKVKKSTLNVNTTHNFLGVLRLIRKDPKYNSFRIIRLEFREERALSIQELGVNRKDFSRLLKKLKAIEKRNHRAT